VEFEERRISLEETTVRVDIIAEENRVMMLDPTTMDPLTKLWWAMRRVEIMEERSSRSWFEWRGS
jgi:hypothetical protein